MSDAQLLDAALRSIGGRPAPLAVAGSAPRRGHRPRVAGARRQPAVDPLPGRLRRAGADGGRVDGHRLADRGAARPRGPCRRARRRRRARARSGRSLRFLTGDSHRFRAPISRPVPRRGATASRAGRWLSCRCGCSASSACRCASHSPGCWVERVRRRALLPVAEAVIARTRELAQRLRRRASRPRRAVGRACRCRRSSGGCARSILLPASALTGLSPAHLDAIIAHELAHVRRHDFAVNLLQTAAEILLFYHPACWWISRRIRAEREHCCDDIAVSLCGDRLVYATALADLEALRGRTTLALAATDGPLLQRVRRLLSPATAAPRPSGWIAAARAAGAGPGAVMASATLTGTAASPGAAVQNQAPAAGQKIPAGTRRRPRADRRRAVRASHRRCRLRNHRARGFGLRHDRRQRAVRDPADQGRHLHDGGARQGLRVGRVRRARHAVRRPDRRPCRPRVVRHRHPPLRLRRHQRPHPRRSRQRAARRGNRARSRERSPARRPAGLGRVRADHRERGLSRHGRAGRLLRARLRRRAAASGQRGQSPHLRVHVLPRRAREGRGPAAAHRRRARPPRHRLHAGHGQTRARAGPGGGPERRQRHGAPHRRNEHEQHRARPPGAVGGDRRRRPFRDPRPRARRLHDQRLGSAPHEPMGRGDEASDARRRRGRSRDARLGRGAGRRAHRARPGQHRGRRFDRGAPHVRATDERGRVHHVRRSHDRPRRHLRDRDARRPGEHRRGVPAATDGASSPFISIAWTWTGRPWT